MRTTKTALRAFLQSRNIPYCTITKDGNNRHRVIYPDSDIGHWLHLTEIVLEKENGEKVLRTEGYRTVTTKTAINENLDYNTKLIQRDFEWIVQKYGECGTLIKETLFQEMMTV